MGDREQLDPAAGAGRKADFAAGAFGGVAREAEHASQERPHAPAGKFPQPSGLHVIDGEVPARRRNQWPGGMDTWALWRVTSAST